MREYRHLLYLSASWRKKDKALTHFIAEMLAKHDLLVVGDHPCYKSEPHERGLDYPQRIDEIYKDCSGLVVILPKRETEQTTSPYMFPELLLATKYHLPVLIFCEEGVKVKLTKENDINILVFGSYKVTNGKLNLIELENNKFENKLVEKTYQVELENLSYLNAPISLPCNIEKLKEKQTEIGEHIDRFCNSLMQDKEKNYTFNIIPFSMINEHKEISRTVFYETSLPCYIATDNWGAGRSARNKWDAYLDNAEFIIADITGMRNTCIFEVGVSYGKEKEIFIITKKLKTSIPFGLDKLTIRKYKNKNELKSIVKEICKPYRRRIINFELLDNPDEYIENWGIPNWYFHKQKLHVANKLLIFVILFSFSISLLLSGLLNLFSSLNNLFSISFGISIAILSIFITTSRIIQNYIEDKILKHLRLAYALTLIFLILSLLIFVISLIMGNTNAI